MLTTSQAAKFLCLSLRTVQLYITEGRLPATRLGGIWVLAEADVVAFGKVARPRGRRWPAKDDSAGLEYEPFPILEPPISHG